jgi:hypothetical protein
MDSRGASAPRVLRRVVLPRDVGATQGALLRVDGAEVGQVTSGAGEVALALVSRGVPVPADAVLALPNGDQPVRLEPLAP